MDLEIRAAEPEDAEVLRKLFLEACQWIHASKGIRQWREEEFSMEYVDSLVRENEVYIAFVGHEPAGCFSIQWEDEAIWGEQFHTDAGYIHRLAVARKYKGLGIGARLLNWAESRIENKGKSWLRLDCMADNPSLNRYYLAQGLTFRGRFDGQGWSASLYERKITV